MLKYSVAGIELDFCKKWEGIRFDNGEFRPIVNSLLSTVHREDQQRRI